jgi:hypothetical protein
MGVCASEGGPQRDTTKRSPTLDDYIPTNPSSVSVLRVVSCHSLQRILHGCIL